MCVCVCVCVCARARARGVCVRGCVCVGVCVCVSTAAFLRILLYKRGMEWFVIYGRGDIGPYAAFYVLAIAVSVCVGGLSGTDLRIYCHIYAFYTYKRANGQQYILLGRVWCGTGYTAVLEPRARLLPYIGIPLTAYDAHLER